MKLKISVIVLIILISSIVSADEKSTIKSLVKFKTSVESSMQYYKCAEFFSEAYSEFQTSKISNLELIEAMLDYHVSLEALKNYTLRCKGVLSQYPSCEDLLKMHLDNFNSGSKHLNNVIKTQRKK